MIANVISEAVCEAETLFNNDDCSGSPLLYILGQLKWVHTHYGVAYSEIRTWIDFIHGSWNEDNQQFKIESSELRSAFDSMVEDME
jgi:hypothetical protein